MPPFDCQHLSFCVHDAASLAWLSERPVSLASTTNGISAQARPRPSVDTWETMEWQKSHQFHEISCCFSKCSRGFIHHYHRNMFSSKLVMKWGFSGAFRVALTIYPFIHQIKRCAAKFDALNSTVDGSLAFTPKIIKNSWDSCMLIVISKLNLKNLLNNCTIWLIDLERMDMNAIKNTSLDYQRVQYSII